MKVGEDVYPILFSVGKVNVYTHGLMIILGAIIGGLIIYYLAKKKQYETSFLFDTIVYSLLGGLIGARILYVILYYYQFADLKEMLFIWYGGLVSYGGIIGGVLVAALVLRIRKQNIWQWFDIGIIGLMVGWAIGRIGCLLNGDSLGIVLNSRIAIWGRAPVPLFESIWAILVAAFCYFLLKRKGKTFLPDGLIFWIGLGLYVFGRIGLDFLRDEEAMLWFLKTGQVGSLLLLIVMGLIIFLIVRKRRKNEGY